MGRVVIRLCEVFTRTKAHLIYKFFSGSVFELLGRSTIKAL